MFATVLRLASRVGTSCKLPSKPVHRSRSSLGRSQPINPKVPAEEAFHLADILHNILKQHGPLNVADCWTHAQAVGFKSKKHMKTMLRWMKERNRVKLIGNYLQKKHDEDSFRYATFFYDSNLHKSDKVEKG